MKIVIAPDSFKESATAVEVATAIKKAGLKLVQPIKLALPLFLTGVRVFLLF